MATKNFGIIGFEAVVNSIHKIKHLEELDLNIGINKCGPRGNLINYNIFPGAEDLKHLLIRHNDLKVLRFNFLENYVGDLGASHIA
jgi:hypothetical protein